MGPVTIVILDIPYKWPKINGFHWGYFTPIALSLSGGESNIWESVPRYLVLGTNPQEIRKTSLGKSAETPSPSSKQSWHWKMSIFDRRYIFKWLFFDCHVSLREGTFIPKDLFIAAFPCLPPISAECEDFRILRAPTSTIIP